MPHFILEHSANLNGQTDVQALCDLILEEALQTGYFELGAVRVRAISCEKYAIADQHEKNAFINITIRMGAGRSADDKKKIGDAIFAAATKQLMPLLNEPYFALSLDIVEINPDLSWKKNTMHNRLRKT
ncbi:MAG: 5-carboxymethyl-2-hydroxymuconate isomerase [Hyphomicrobiales bacterium]|nr:MAG: 5-carboxymethyl-2-hydroxymuconate isomerase [Hyphomicrobiales bacterium]